MSNIDFPSSPTNGQLFRDWKWSSTRSAWDWNTLPKYNFEYVVVAGGGSGGAGNVNYVAAAGGGAGGYRSNVVGEMSGGGVNAEGTAVISPGSYIVTIGAGGAGLTAGALTWGNDGTASTFGAITTVGGGGGGASLGNTNYRFPGRNGGSGGGAPGVGDPPWNVAGTGTPGQGFAGGDPVNVGGGGGGAGEAGDTDGISHGGDGVASSITGSSVTRAGGGGGGAASSAPPGGDGGGGAGANGASSNGVNGSANTGGGGGAGYAGTRASGAGGSGVVIIKYPDTLTLTIGPGLTSSTTTSGGFKITSFTAGTDTVTVG